MRPPELDPHATLAASPARAPRFGGGFLCFFDAAWFVASEPFVWRFVLGPALLVLAIVVYLADVASSWLAAQRAEGNDAPATLDAWLRANWSAAWFVPAVAVSLVIACVVQPLTAFSLDGLARDRLNQDRRHFETGADALFRTAETTVGALLFALPLLGVLSMATALYPQSWPVALVVALLVSSFALTWNFIDYTMWRREITRPGRLRWMWKHLGAVVGLGLPCSIAMLVPGVGLLAVPIGVAAATRLVADCDARPRRAK